MNNVPKCVLKKVSIVAPLNPNIKHLHGKSKLLVVITNHKIVV